MAPKKIFISYRRADSQWPADRLKEVLAAHVDDPARDIFMDVDNIPLGVNFLQYVDARVKQCDVLLALIGPAWLNVRDDKTGGRRLDDPEDFVRLEIGAALARGIPVVPVLLDGATMPQAADLPANLRELSLRNGVDVRRISFDADADRLVKGLGLVRRRGAPGPGGPTTSYGATEATSKKPGWVLPAVGVGVLAAAGAAAFVFMGQQAPQEGAMDPAASVTAPVAPGEATVPQDPAEVRAAENAFFSSPYTYCDAKVLAAHWNQDIYLGKIAIGQKILAGIEMTLIEALDQAFASQSTRTNPVCVFSETGLSPDDASVLAAVWGVSVPQAKLEVQEKIQLNGRVGMANVRAILAAPPIPN